MTHRLFQTSFLFLVLTVDLVYCSADLLFILFIYTLITVGSIQKLTT